MTTHLGLLEFALRRAQVARIQGFQGICAVRLRKSQISALRKQWFRPEAFEGWSQSKFHKNMISVMAEAPASDDPDGKCCRWTKHAVSRAIR